MPDPDLPQLTAEDAKLVSLARSARARTRAAEGAAVRDLDGRTYAGASVTLPSLTVSAVGVTVAMAASSAAAGLEAAVVLGDSPSVDDRDLAIVRDFAGPGVPVLRADPKGDVTGTATT